MKKILWRGSAFCFAIIMLLECFGNVVYANGNEQICFNENQYKNVTSTLKCNESIALVDDEKRNLLTEIRLSQTVWNANPGWITTLRATVKPNDATNIELSWLSTDESVATVDQRGRVTAVGLGTAKIIVSAQDESGVSATCDVIIRPPVEIILNETSIALGVNETFDLDAIVEPESSVIGDIIWSSHDKNIAEVDENGVITAISAGKTIIQCFVHTVENSGVGTYCYLTVLNRISEVDLNINNLDLYLYDTYSFDIKILPENATDKNVKWTSSDESVATVDENGNLTALKIGTTTITVIAQDGSGASDSCIVTVSKFREDGLHEAEDGNWYYYIDDKIATDYTGLIEHNGTWFYIENGRLNWDYTGLIFFEDNWFYIERGSWNREYTGLTNYYDTWYYVENGVLNWNYTGLTLYYDTWYYIESGVLNWNYTSLTLYGDTWYYVENGILNWNYIGLTYYDKVWYYVENGILNWNYTGLTYYYDTWYYVENGSLNWNYTGLTYYYDTWYYVENGILNWKYTGLTCYYDTWYYVENGMLNWEYIGLTYYYDTWYYVENGVLYWNYTGLYNHYDTWYYLENSVLDFSYTGLTYYYGTWYYVEKSILNLNFTGFSEYYGTSYYVKNGTINWEFSGTLFLESDWWNIKNGIRVGLADVPSKTWYDEDGFYYCMSKWELHNFDGEIERFYTGYVIAPATNYKIIVDDAALKYSVSDFTKKLANAGYYNIIWHLEGRGRSMVAMLIKSGEESWDYFDYLREVAEANGYRTGNGSGNHVSIIDINGETCYKVSVDIYEE